MPSRQQCCLSLGLSPSSARASWLCVAPSARWFLHHSTLAGRLVSVCCHLSCLAVSLLPSGRHASSRSGASARGCPSLCPGLATFAGPFCICSRSCFSMRRKILTRPFSSARLHTLVSLVDSGPTRSRHPTGVASFRTLPHNRARWHCQSSCRSCALWVVLLLALVARSLARACCLARDRRAAFPVGQSPARETPLNASTQEPSLD